MGKFGKSFRDSKSFGRGTQFKFFINAWWVALSIFVSAETLRADTWVFSDVDGTLFAYKPTENGAFDTPYMLTRISGRPTLLMEHPTEVGPETLEISMADYHRLAGDLATSDTQPGSIKMVATLQSGETFRPGYYWVNPADPRTFRYFRPRLPGVKDPYILRFFKEAEVKITAGEGTFMGRAWPLMVAALNDPVQSKFFGILSARGHDPEEWMTFFKYLRAKKYIKFLPRPELINGMTRPEFDRFGATHDIAGRKAALAARLFKLIARVSLNETDLTLNPEGTAVERFKTLIIAEDDQHTVDLHLNTLRPLVQSRLGHVKVIILNAGLSSEVRESDRPRSFVIESDGLLRKPRKEDFAPVYASVCDVFDVKRGGVDK